ncbi:hypothetical protein CPER28S_00642 [Cellulomonas persica]
MSTMPSSSERKTTSRCSVEVELYRCTIACLAPAIASYVRSIRCSRDCVSTWITTSSGIRPSSMSIRTKSKSVCDAAGKPTSISLKPMSTSSSNISSLRAGFIGSIRAWLPSRRSTAHQRGAFVMRASGHRRSGRSTLMISWNGRYLWIGMPDGCCGLVC